MTTQTLNKQTNKQTPALERPYIPDQMFLSGTGRAEDLRIQKQDGVLKLQRRQVLRLIQLSVQVSSVSNSRVKLFTSSCDCKYCFPLKMSNVSASFHILLVKNKIHHGILLLQNLQLVLSLLHLQQRSSSRWRKARGGVEQQQLTAHRSLMATYTTLHDRGG